MFMSQTLSLPFYTRHLAERNHSDFHYCLRLGERTYKCKHVSHLKLCHARVSSFCSYDLERDSMTLKYELNLKMYPYTKNKVS